MVKIIHINRLKDASGGLLGLSCAMAYMATPYRPKKLMMPIAIKILTTPQNIFTRLSFDLSNNTNPSKNKHQNV